MHINHQESPFVCAITVPHSRGDLNCDDLSTHKAAMSSRHDKELSSTMQMNTYGKVAEERSGYKSPTFDGRAI